MKNDGWLIMQSGGEGFLREMMRESCLDRARERRRRGEWGIRAKLPFPLSLSTSFLPASPHHVIIIEKKNPR